MKTFRRDGRFDRRLAGLPLAALVFCQGLHAKDIGLTTGDNDAVAQQEQVVAVELFVKSVPVRSGLSPEDVVDSLKSLAIESDLLFLGEVPFSKQVEVVTKKPYRFLSLYSFTDPPVGVMLVNDRIAYSALLYRPIAVAQDQNGRL